MTFEVEFILNLADCAIVSPEMIDGCFYYKDVEVWLEKIEMGTSGENKYLDFVTWDEFQYTLFENEQITQQVNRSNWLIKELKKHYEQTKIDV